jgi:hypothetical protein
MRSLSPKKVKKFEDRQIVRFRKWHARRPGWFARLVAWLTTPIVWVFRHVIPHSAVETTLHGNFWLARRWARERTTLKTLGVSSFDELADAELLHADRAVRKIHSRATWLAAVIGVASGTFGVFALPVGMAAALNLALRTIQRIGLCYGYAAQTEAERLFIYYTLSLAGNRAPDEKTVSLEALRELQARIAQAAPVAESSAAEPIDEKIRHHAFSIAHHDFSREITKQLVEVRLLTAIPGIGAIMGLIVDTNYMRSVGWAARHAYQHRWLRDRGRWPEQEPETA